MNETKFYVILKILVLLFCVIILTFKKEKSFNKIYTHMHILFAIFDIKKHHRKKDFQIIILSLCR